MNFTELALCGELTFAQLVKNLPALMELKGSLRTYKSPLP
jgi:hypothetical protein